MKHKQAKGLHAHKLKKQIKLCHAPFQVIKWEENQKEEGGVAATYALISLYFRLCLHLFIISDLLFSGISSKNFSGIFRIASLSDRHRSYTRFPHR